MVRYPITKQKLMNLIDAEKADWRTRAAERTEEFRKSGFYKESSAIWSEIKAVYMRLQGNKCAYCERELESEAIGKVEHDVEHFRPKSNVKQWSPKKLVDMGITFTAPKKGEGYYLLPYHILNYAVACKPCNSTLKTDRFPIRGPYKVTADDPTTLKSEQQYLIFPIGDIDADPETLIEFYGASPRPIAKTGKKRDRAIVTIEFFKLDDPLKRKFLYRDRSIMLIALFQMLQQTQKGTAAQKAASQDVVDNFLATNPRHLNCARSFVNLFRKNPKEASDICDAAVRFITSAS